MKNTHLCVFASLNFIGGYSQLTYEDETFIYGEETIEFETDDFDRSMSNADNTFTPITTYKGISYFILIDSNNRPKIGKIENGETRLEPIFLDNVEGDDAYFVFDDGHNKFSIGVDKDGYIHVLGDMHHYGSRSSFNLEHYKERYSPTNFDGLDPSINSRADLTNGTMYWVSKNPEDITSFEFVGGDEDRAIPGFGFSYPKFLSDMNGDLYTSHRGKISFVGHYDGEMGAILSKYDEETRRWIELGDLVNDVDSNKANDPLYKSVFWEDNGISTSDPDKNWYQGLTGDVMFDFNNRMHLSVSINNNNDKGFMTDVVYVYSDDQGASFHKVDGSIVEAPIRVEVGPSQGSIVSSESESLEGYHLWTSVFFDKDGTPAVNYTKLDNSKDDSFLLGTYKCWDEENNIWSEEKDSPVFGYHSHRHIMDANGVITYMHIDNGGKVVRDFGLNSSVDESTSYNIGAVLYGVDQRAIREQNVIRGFFYDKNGGPLQIRAMKGIPNLTPISEEWETTSIGGANGEIGMFKDIFQLKSMGTFDESISGEYLNQSIRGDFELEARVINVNYVKNSNGNESFAGILVRDRDEEDSAYFGVAVSSHEGVKTNSLNMEGEFESIKVEGYESSEWLKIKRTGHLLESFRSDNGKDWEFMDRRGVVMTEIVHVGLISGSGNLESKGHARVDHVSIKDLNLVAHYSLNDNVLDTSENELHGIDNEVFNYEIEGKDQSLNLGTTSDYVTVDSNDLLTPENFTVSAWIKTSNLNGIKGIIRSADSDGASSGWRLIMDESSIVARISTDEVTEIVQSSELIANEWNYVALTYDNNEMIMVLYVNGELSKSSPLSGNIIYPRELPMEIGHSSGVDNFEGQIDEVKLYNYALDQSLILNEYEEENEYFLSSPSAKGLVSGIEQNISTVEEGNIIISLYPNPANEIINIVYPNFIGGEDVQIIDARGRILINEKMEDVNSVVDISNLESNIFFLKISDYNGEVTIKKILVE